MIEPRDELRHPAGSAEHWRESVYFNLTDPDNELGGWIYLWSTPNAIPRSGMLVSLYHGANPGAGVTDEAMAAHRHLLERDGAWVYCFKRTFDEDVAGNFDDVEHGGLRLRREAPLHRYRITFADDEGNSGELTCRFMTPAYDYADGANRSPAWLADNRYHRGWWARGQVTIAGRRYDIDTTGDSDHSWGTRDPVRLSSGPFKMWSFQARDGSMSLSAIKLGDGPGAIDLGYVDADGLQASVLSLDAGVDRPGVPPQDVSLVVADSAGRNLRVSFDRMHSFIGTVGGSSPARGFEGVATYQVDGHGQLPGLCSYFWPPAQIGMGEEKS